MDQMNTLPGSVGPIKVCLDQDSNDLWKACPWVIGCNGGEGTRISFDAWHCPHMHHAASGRPAVINKFDPKKVGAACFWTIKHVYWADI